MKINKCKILTSREQDVLLYSIEGMTNLQIANKLCISHHTVKAHLDRLFTKLNVHNKVQLAMRAIQSGIVEI